MSNKESRVVLTEKLLLKYGLKLTLQQIEDTQEGEVVNGCLILKKYDYEASKFKARDDFKAVIALKLGRVPANMFFKAKNLKIVMMPAVEEIADGLEEDEEIGESNEQMSQPIEEDQNNFEEEQIEEQIDGYNSLDESEEMNSDDQLGEDIEQTEENEDFRYGGAFAQTDVESCYFPLLKRVGAFAFCKCRLQSLDQENFPALQAVGECGFADCSFTQVDLPSLTSVGDKGFLGCDHLRRFSTQKLQQIGVGCFSSCPQLVGIDCQLEPEDFVCKLHYDDLYTECDGCPVCFCDVAACLQRGRSGKLEGVEKDHEVLDGVLKKFQIGVTVQQALDAKEGQIINGCLILKQEHYQEGAFEEKTDFKSVLALKLRNVSKSMFECVKTLENAIMPETLGVAWAGFYQTGLKNCYFPKLVHTGDSAFQECQIGKITRDTFPALQTVGKQGFSYCPFSEVDLPNLVLVGDEGFAGCTNLRQFSAQKLQKIGDGCFSFCYQLAAVDCGLEPEQFTCKVYNEEEDEYCECGRCPICTGDLLECLRRGTLKRKLQQILKDQNSLMAHLFQLFRHKQNEKEEIGKCDVKLQKMGRKLEDTFESE